MYFIRLTRMGRFNSGVVRNFDICINLSVFMLSCRRTFLFSTPNSIFNLESL